MKKNLSLFLIIALCFATLASCGNTGTTPTTGSTVGTEASTTASVPLAELFGSTTPIVKAPSGSDLTEYSNYVCAQGNRAGAPPMEKNFWNDNIGIEKPFSNTKVTFNDTEYNLTYDESYYKIGSQYRKHSYSAHDGDISFYMHEATQECIGFWFSPILFVEDDNLPDIENFETEVLNIADKYVSKIININDYERTYKEEIYDAILFNTKVYKITYTKYYKDIKTNDYIEIEITSKGDVKSIYINNIGAFDEVTKDIDIEKVNESVEEKIYTSCKKEVVGYEIYDQYLGHTPDGDLVVISYVRITLANNSTIAPTSKTATIIATAV